MAENGHLMNNNNRSPATNSTTRASSVEEAGGRTESDATHYRLRGDLHSKKYFFCRSCFSRFEGNSLMQVYEHYGEVKHKNYFSLCLYCQGKVHQYHEENNNKLQIYHNCLRWKRGKDK